MTLILALFLAVFVGGCAHQRPQTISAFPPPQAATIGEGPKAPPSTAPSRVDLPYTFIRHGVEVRVNAIEFDREGNLAVDLTLQELRGGNVELAADRLLEARTPAGQILPYSAVSRRGEHLPGPAIQIAPHEVTPFTLVFQPVSLSSSTVEGPEAIELHFPTGKWWSSAAQD